MLKNFFRIKIIFLFLIFIFINGKICPAKEVYILGMLPIYYPEKIGQMILPLGIYLNEKTNFRILLTFTDNSNEFETLAEKGEIQLGYQNPVSWTNISDAHQVIARAVEEDGSQEYRGIIIVPAQSTISSIDELRDKTIMIVGKNSGGGYLSQKFTLMSFGIDTEKDLKLVKAAEGKHENVVISVSLGDVDAGFIRESALIDSINYTRPGSLRILKKCRPLPGWSFSVSRKMPEKDKETIKNVLVNIPLGHAVLKALGIKKIVSAEDNDYIKIKQIENY
jgi:phosphonate transport system substrate-binding protein